MDTNAVPQKTDDSDNFYTLVPEQGMCLVDDTIINLRRVVIVRRQEGKTLIYYAGVADPVILPVTMFDRIRDAVFAMDDFDDDEEEEYDEDME